MRCALLCSSIFLLTCLQIGHAQSMYYLKLGPTVGFQKWNDYGKRSPLYKYHVALMVENGDVEEKYGFFASLGYHAKGSAIRFGSYISSTGQNIPVRTFENLFGNLSLSLGLKSKKPFVNNSQYYYGLGVRGDYTVHTKLEVFGYPEDAIKKFNYGLWLGGGIEFPLASQRFILELSVSPDISKQVIVEAYRYKDPITGLIEFVPSQRQTNTAMELSLGIQFWGRPPLETEYEEEELQEN